MDPEQCWREIGEAYESRRRDELEERIAAMLEWLDRGGAPPKAVKFDNQWTLRLATRVLCRRFLKEASQWAY